MNTSMTARGTSSSTMRKHLDALAVVMEED
jgi:hypothetical protein